ncbi:MAG TPA: class II aldolase/adducin family protein [Kofleriaceae bacterium]|nr:class II aldolase/adducin family protein [Kofleriaceae bacterium]
MTSATLRARVAATARDLHARGWAANHDGNVTARDGARYAATPTATSKRLIGERDVIELDAAGKVTGSGKVFGEIGLHLAVYQRRPDVGAVIHAHPPHATAIACARGGALDHPIARPFIAEAVVSLGPAIPRVAFAPPGEPAVKALAPWCEHVDAVLLGGHGALAWGADLEQAFLRLELVEHLARVALAAVPLGGVEPLPEAALPALYAARARAGLGRAADRAVAIADELARAHPSPAASSPRPVVACAPAPHSPVPTVEPVRPGGVDLAAVVREEIVRALRGE